MKEVPQYSQETGERVRDKTVPLSENELKSYQEKINKNKYSIAFGAL